MPLIVTPASMKKRRGPVIPLSEQQQTNDNGQGAAAGAQPLFSGSRNKLDDYDLEERRRAGERAQALREIARPGCTARE